MGNVNERDIMGPPAGKSRRTQTSRLHTLEQYVAPLLEMAMHMSESGLYFGTDMSVKIRGDIGAGCSSTCMVDQEIWVGLQSLHKRRHCKYMVCFILDNGV